MKKVQCIVTSAEEVEKMLRRVLNNPLFKLLYNEEFNWYEGCVGDGICLDADAIDSLLSAHFDANCVTYAIAEGGIIIVFDKAVQEEEE